MKRLLLIVLCLANPALADRFVTDPAMCAYDDPIDTQEMGMTLDASSFWAIEYFCEFEPPIMLDWTADRMQSRVGYCSEPGVITPMVFTFQTSQYEPGEVHLWEQGMEEATVFHRCKDG